MLWPGSLSAATIPDGCPNAGYISKRIYGGNMLHALRSLTVLLVLMAAGAAVGAEVKPYAREDMASDVVRLTATLRGETAAIGAEVKGKSADQLRKDAALAVAASKFDAAQKLAGARGHRRAQGPRQLAGPGECRDQRRRRQI